MTEHEQLEYNDALVSFASLIQTKGANKVLLDFQTHYPAYFHELQQSIPKLPQKPMAALLRK
jgi:DNA-binding HxlR family transcriptional regulator